MALFLIDLTDVTVFMITVTMYLIMNINVYVYIYIYIMLKHLEYFCYYKVLGLPAKWYNVDWKWPWIICKYIVNYKATTKKVFKTCNRYAKKGEKLNNMKQPVENVKKSVNDKN